MKKSLIVLVIALFSSPAFTADFVLCKATSLKSDAVSHQDWLIQDNKNQFIVYPLDDGKISLAINSVSMNKISGNRLYGIRRIYQNYMAEAARDSYGYYLRDDMMMVFGKFTNCVPAPTSLIKSIAEYNQKRKTDVETNMNNIRKHEAEEKAKLQSKRDAEIVAKKAIFDQNQKRFLSFNQKYPNLQLYDMNLESLVSLTNKYNRKFTCDLVVLGPVSDKKFMPLDYRKKGIIVETHTDGSALATFKLDNMLSDTTLKFTATSIYPKMQTNNGNLIIKMSEQKLDIVYGVYSCDENFW